MGHAQTLAPDISPDELARATARMQLYFAQRSIRANGERRAAARHIRAAVRTFPGILAERPQSVLAVALSTVLPGLTRNLVTLSRSFRHA